MSEEVKVPKPQGRGGKAKKTKKGRKVGRAKQRGIAYRAAGIREINKGIRLLRTIKVRPCPSAFEAWGRLDLISQAAARRGYKVRFGVAAGEIA